jgi:hypothetical protein
VSYHSNVETNTCSCLSVKNLIVHNEFSAAQQSLPMSSSAAFSPSPPPSRLLSGLLPFPPSLSCQTDTFSPGKDVPNMFHFGDVSVNHHPDTPPVPMVIPMVYLYPLPSQDQGKIVTLYVIGS